MKGTKSKNKYKELTKLTPLGLTILKWYSIATMSLLAGYMILRAERDEEVKNKYMFVVTMILGPAVILIMGGV